MTVPILLYGSECWLPRQEDLSVLQTAEIKFLQAVKGCSRLDRVYKEDIHEALGVEKLATTACCYKVDWRDHVLRISPDRTMRKMIHCPHYKRNVGQPRQ